VEGPEFKLQHHKKEKTVPKMNSKLYFEYSIYWKIIKKKKTF
jgi:hypothetical protein